MKKLRNYLIGVDQGQVLLFSDFVDGGPMWTGEGPRIARKDVMFSEPFRNVPQVMVTLSMFDMDQASNQRADIAAEDITPEGFAVAFRTWGDTRVARVRADWLAIGEMAHEDDWQID